MYLSTLARRSPRYLLSSTTQIFPNHPPRPFPGIPLLLSRSYAKPSKKGKSKQSLRDEDNDPLPDDNDTTVLRTKGKSSRKGALPSGSHRPGEEPLDDAPAVEVQERVILEKMEGRMKGGVEHFKGLVFDGVERGRGRANPAILDSVRVLLSSDNNSKSKASEPLNDVASVTVQKAQGNVPGGLRVEVFDKDSTKRVLSAITAANLPGVVPNKVDEMVLFIPISRPTETQRNSTLTHLSTSSESAKVQIRNARTDALKSVKRVEKISGEAGGGKGSGKTGGRGDKGGGGSSGGKMVGVEKDIQDATDKHVGMIDDLLNNAKKELAKA